MRLRALFDTRPVLGAGVLVVAAAALGATAIGLRAGACGAEAAAVTASGATPALAVGLAPAPAAIRYRFDDAARGAGDTAAPDAELTSMITALEARMRTPAGSAFDLGELADLYLRRAKLTGTHEDHALAEQTAARSLALLPAPNGAVLVLAKLALARHQFTEAIELANRHQRGRSAGGLTILATAHLALGELAAAAAAAEALVAQQGDSAAFLLRALVLQAQGRDAEAAFDFERAVATEEPGDLAEAARRRALWGRFLLRRGELAGARLVIAEALRIAPGHALALALDGELLLRTGRAKDARARFEQAFAATRQVRYLIDQARAQTVEGDRAGADRLRGQVEKLVRADLGAGGTGHQLELIEILIDRGAPADLEEAARLAREEVARRPSAETRFQLARALARTGSPDEALRNVHAALSAGTRDAALYELAARLERARGNAPRAALYTREADRLDPGRAGWRAAGLP